MKMMAGKRATATDTTEDPGTKCAGASWKFFSSFIAFIVPVPETGQSGDEIPEPALIYPRFPFFSRGKIKKIKKLILYRKQGTPPSACDTPPRIKNQGKNPPPAWNFIHLCFCSAQAFADTSSAHAGLARIPHSNASRLAPGRLFNMPFLRATGPRKRKGRPQERKSPAGRIGGASFSLSQLSIPSISFCSDHSTGSACFSLSTLNPSGRFPVRTAWMISGASSVSRSTRAT